MQDQRSVRRWLVATMVGPEVTCWSLQMLVVMGRVGRDDGWSEWDELVEWDVTMSRVGEGDVERDRGNRSWESRRACFHFPRIAA
jgi:hypothetical protein